jgi:hypothetical protein
MNKITQVFIIFVLLLFGAPSALNAESASNTSHDSLLFRNGDLLYGKLLAVDPASSVRWQHPDVARPIEFKPDSVAQIDFPDQKMPPTFPTNACRLVLANGDSLEGDLVSCDRQGIVLWTWYAGRLAIPRNMLQSLVFIRRSSAVFDGITGLDGWTQAASAAPGLGDAGQWTYRGGAFYADKTASIARDFKLPDATEIQFDLAWKGTLNLAIALYTDSLRPILLTAKDQAPDFGGFYSFRFQGTAFVDLWAIKKLAPVRPLGQIMVPSLNGRDRIHVDLRVSKAQHEIALLLDDTLVKEWVDPEGFIGEGTALRFVQNPGSVIKLSNLRITPWDGIFEEPSDDSAEACWLENGQKLAATIESIRNGRVSVRGTNGPAEFSLAKLRGISFARHEAPPAQTQAATVRATFGQGGNVTFSLESWRPDKMIIRSADFGKAEIDPSAFTRLQFIYPDKIAPEEPKG